MATLGEHSGENATLPASDSATIVAYLVAHAGDAPGTTLACGGPTLAGEHQPGSALEAP